jgi:DNA-binding NarL/FixJ family response regulator
MTRDGETGSGPIRVLLTDDHPIVRSGLVALLDTLPGIEVVAQAGSGEEAVREAALVRPDVIVMDLRLPGMSGVEAIRAIRHHDPAASILVLTMFDEDALVADALRAGARGYLLKGAEQNEIERAIRAVAAGEAIFANRVAATILERFADPRRVKILPQLTPRETEVLDLIANGSDNSAIAARLGIAAKTVGNHISAIFLKMQVATRSEAIVAARDAGLGRRG